MLIHIKRSTEVFGPYSIEEARGYLATGRLSPSDFAQLEGTSEWVPLSSVPGIQHAPPPPLDANAPVSQQAKDDVHIGRIIRDVVIVAVLTAIGGFAVGLTGVKAEMSSPGFVLAIAASNLLLGTVGFIIVGCLASGDRWRHLVHVAIGVWLVGLLNVLIGISLTQWFFSAIFVGIIMGVGGGLSFAFKRR